MSKLIAVLVVAGACLAATFLPAQACKNPETVVTNVEQDLTGTVNTVRKETLQDFDRQFHQQATESKLSICLDTVTDVLTCLDKASHDATATPAQQSAVKAEEAKYTKLKDSLQQDSASLKSAKDDKSAKAEIEKFNFSD